MHTHSDVFTAQAISGLQEAHRLASRTKQRCIKGDDLFFGVCMVLRQHGLRDVFCQLVGIESQDIFTGYPEQKYRLEGSHLDYLPEKTLPFSRPLSKQLQKIMTPSKASLDLGVLFYISFRDLSSPCIEHLTGLGIDTRSLYQTSQKLFTANAISQYGLFAFLGVLNKILIAFHLDPSTLHLMNIENIQDPSDINMLLDAIDSEIMERNDTTTGEADKGKKEEKKLTIEYFGTDLTKDVKEGFLDPVIGRENEINQVIYTLLRKNKNNPLLLGEAGVGKTAIVEGLAQKIVSGDVPDKLLHKKIFLLDMGSLLAGTKYRGEFEARMKSILEEAMDPTNNIILFIDEIHTIIGAGGQDNNDAAQMIKPLLARGKVKLIGATTFNEYQKHIEKDAALKRRFQEVIVNEPDPESALAILKGLKQTYEDFHGVQITDEALETAVNLSRRYMMNKFLPDKALDIIDEACARESTMTQKLDNDDEYKTYEETLAKLQKKIEESIEKQDYFGAAELKDKEEQIKTNMNKIRTSKNIPTHLRPVIDAVDIGNVLADKTGIPTNIVNEDEITKLRRLAENLKKTIIGQDEAVEAVVKTLTRSRLSVITKKKPIGSFLFLGPSGVGKTFLAKLIAKDYFGDENALIRIDMSEFMEKYSVSKLIGSPAGYIGYEEGGNLTESVRRKPYSVILFDEIEKAATDVLNIMLQILDEGHLKDAKGRRIDFKNTIIIMTSNIGGDEFAKKQSRIGFANADEKTADKDFELVKTRVLEEMKNFLAPELLNRIDYKIVFKHLEKPVLVDILKTKLHDFLGTWKEKSDIALPKFTDKKLQEIIDKIYDPQYGARPVERYIQDEVEPELINKILNKKGK